VDYLRYSPNERLTYFLEAATLYITDHLRSRPISQTLSEIPEQPPHIVSPHSVIFTPQSTQIISHLFEISEQATMDLGIPCWFFDVLFYTNISSHFLSYSTKLPELANRCQRTKNHG
jgi:hypothetical protein